jgi:DNA-binding response OmpR family regulator
VLGKVPKISEWECRAIPASYAFGPFRLDAQGETLFRGTEPVALSHRAVALLRILIDRGGPSHKGRTDGGGVAGPRGRG